MFLVLIAVMATIGGLIGNKKTMGPIAGAALGFFLGLIGIIIILCTKDKPVAAKL